MNRNLAKYLSVYSEIDTTLVDKYQIPEPPHDDSELMKVLNEIFSVDPVSGFPRGDISYFLSPEGNPQVKAWLEQNLLQPRVKDSGTSIEGVTDDMIAEMSRKSDESVSDYQSRLTSIFDSAKAEYERLVNDMKSIKSE